MINKLLYLLLKQILTEGKLPTQTEINMKSKSRLYFLEVSLIMEESRNFSGFFMNIQNSFYNIGSLSILICFIE
ncbi:hypothetical protein DOZ91_10900 [Peribacillus frigoritolerans]|nr:hypothetical protein DOZ91_10900 [Peribacillus frigoritolerans]